MVSTNCKHSISIRVNRLQRFWHDSYTGRVSLLTSLSAWKSIPPLYAIRDFRCGVFFRRSVVAQPHMTRPHVLQKRLSKRAVNTGAITPMKISRLPQISAAIIIGTANSVSGLEWVITRLPCFGSQRPDFPGGKKGAGPCMPPLYACRPLLGLARHYHGLVDRRSRASGNRELGVARFEVVLEVVGLRRDRRRVNAARLVGHENVLPRAAA